MRMAQWIRRLPTEQEIPGSDSGFESDRYVVFPRILVDYVVFTHKTRVQMLK